MRRRDASLRAERSPALRSKIRVAAPRSGHEDPVMSTKATAPPPDPYRSPFGQELAPSAVRSDEPSGARMVGMAGLALVFVGMAVLFFNRLGPRWIGPAWGQAFVILG